MRSFLNLPILACVLAAGPTLAARPLPVHPTTAQLREARLFSEPLIPLGEAPSDDENTAFAQALEACSTPGSSLDSLQSFLEDHPRSPWRASLLLNLGITFRETGYFTRALEAWEEAWSLAKEATGEGSAVANRAAGELAELNARLGRVPRLRALFEELGGRPLSGLAAEKVRGAQEGLALMARRPERAYRCGPLALASILAHSDSADRRISSLDAIDCTDHGSSLVLLQEASDKLKLGLRMAKREPGAAFPVPCVVHWKAGHFGALVASSGTRYLLQDPTFGSEIWIGREALEAEASGYAMIQDGPMPIGWKKVRAREGAKVWGQGSAADGDPGDTGPCDPQVGGDLNACGGSAGMPRYNFHASLANLHAVDTPLGYKPPYGPEMPFRITYNHREYGRPQVPNFTNLGPRWSFHWVSYLEINPRLGLLDPQTVSRFGGDGGMLRFYSDSTGQFAPQLKVHAQLVRTSATSFELRYPDGSKEIYDLSDGALTSPQRLFLTKVVDPAGNVASVVYDAQCRIVEIRDALGQKTALEYGDKDSYGNYWDAYKVTKITDPFGRTAQFHYTGNSIYPHGILDTVQDALGLTTTFAYQVPSLATNVPVSGGSGSGSGGGAGSGGTICSTCNPSIADFMVSMITPYGTTQFQENYALGLANGGSAYQVGILAIDPLGQQELMQPLQNSTLVADTDPAYPPNQSAYGTYLSWRNTFYWSKRVVPSGIPVSSTHAAIFTPSAGDLARARAFHWYHDTVNGSVHSSALENLKEPLESRTFFVNTDAPDAPVHSDPSASRLPHQVWHQLDDGTWAQRAQTYNSWGKPLWFRDPKGRATLFTYSPEGLDLLQIRQVNPASTSGTDLLVNYTYNAQHLPATVTDASGQTTSLSYNPRGQLASAINSKGETTTLIYDDRGYLSQVQQPITGATTTFTWDAAGRLGTAKATDGYTLGFTYDALDRLTQVSFPDGTTETRTYDRLDVAVVKDRANQVTTYGYNALRQLVSVTDPLQRTTRYGWCACGQDLESMTDPGGALTTWTRDWQGRVVAKTYPDRTQTTFTYERNSSRLAEVMDARGQYTRYGYDLDDRLLRTTYQSNVAYATPPVRFTYDGVYPRLSTMTDGLGTTTYAYYPINAAPTSNDGHLKSVMGPWQNASIAYTYDALGRVATKTVNGASQSFAYDAMGRLTGVANALGAFHYAYDGPTHRLARLDYPNGQTASLAYWDDRYDRALQSLRNQATGGSLSAFTYSYDSTSHEMDSWTQQSGIATPKTYNLYYDFAGQLVRAYLYTGSQLSNSLRFTYDPSGNRTGETQSGFDSHFGLNGLNQPTTRTTYGPLPAP